MIKSDELGTYNDEEIPEGMTFPYGVDFMNEGIVTGDNVILNRYAVGSTEASYKLQEKRKNEFLAKMANGDIIVLKDKTAKDRVFRRVKRTMGKNGNILCEFEEVRVGAGIGG